MTSETDVERDMTGETVCGFRVAAWRETHPEHGDKFGHSYSEHWSTPSQNPDVKVERLFTETQLLAALSRAPEAEAVGWTVGWAALADNGNIRFWKADKSAVQLFAFEHGCEVIRLVSPSPEMGEISREELAAAVADRVQAHVHGMGDIRQRFGHLDFERIGKAVAERVLSKLKENGLSREELGGLARSLPSGDAQERSPVPPLSDGGRRAILDPCCGSRMFWFDREDERAVFGDIRRAEFDLTDKSSAGGSRRLVIDPDHLLDFRDMPFPDEQFHLVVFDPPHLIQNGKSGWLAKKYGKLGDDWRADIKAGFAECFRVLKPNGTLIFKWNEHEVRVSELLKLTDQKPLFGNRCGKTAKSHWIVFMKPAQQVSTPSSSGEG